MFDANAASLDINQYFVDLELWEKAGRSRSLSLRLRYVQWRWERLADIDQHLCLQNAVKEQLWHDKYRNNADGNVLDSFNPLE